MKREGIIPARAGFTAARVGTVPDPSGSSPLARGLPRPVSESIRFRRIIPARAGFTAWLTFIYVWLPDHPRSRGVYGGVVPRLLQREGSSPLARGLRLRIVGIPTSP